MKKQLFCIFFLILSPLCFTNVEASSSFQEKTEEKPVLLLYYLPWCPYCQNVLSYLNSIHKTVPLENLQKNPKGRIEIQKIGGKTQVPCLIIDGYPLYESGAIIKWLSENREYLDPA
jgi:glutaredoxin